MDESITPITAGSSPTDATPEGFTANPEYLALRLDEYQIAQFWPVLAQTIAASTPPDADPDPYMTPRVFEELQTGRMHAWAMVRHPHEKPQIVMLMTTRWVQDGLSGEKHLAIFSLYGYEPVRGRVLREAFQTLAAFARGGGATRIVAYTSNPRVIEMAEAAGADTAWRFLHWRV